jgi:hypothetical protein
MIIDAPPKLWIPPKPAIIRPAGAGLAREAHLATLFPIFVPSGKLPTLAFTDTDSSSSDVSTYTFTSASLGTAGATRHIIVGFAAGQLGANLNAPNSCTIAGVSATLVISDPVGTGLSWRQFWIAAVPTGTTGNIVLTRAGNMSSGAIVVWAAYDLISATAFATGTPGSGTPTASANCNTSAGGIAVGFARGSSSSTFTWSGLTEDADFLIGGDTVSISGASASNTPAASPRSISATASAAAANLITASFR